MTSIATGTLAWLLTYAVHSTALLGIAWLVSRRASTSPGVRDVIWKATLVGGIITATAQRTLDIRPAGSLALDARPSAAAAAERHTVVIDAAPALPDSLSPSVANGTHDAGASRAAIVGVARSISPATVIVSAWAAIGVCLALIFAARRLILVGRLGDRRPVLEGALPAMLATLHRDAGYRRSVRLTSSATISSPVALGASEICVPEAALTQLEADEQRGLLAHELAHLARRDPLWLDFVGIVERVFFFQPLNRLARRELQLVAEYLCDDWAAARSGGGLPLAHCLARVAEWIQASPLGVPVAGMAEQRSLLVARIARLIDGDQPAAPIKRGAVATAVAALLVITVSAAPGVQGGARPDSQATPRRAAGDSVASQPQVEQEQDTTVVKALIERLKDTDAGVRRAAAASLGNLRAQRAVPALIAALGDKDREVREAIAHALGELEDERTVVPLTQLIGDPYSEVRSAALDALNRFARQVPAAPVIAALQDANPDVRARAASLLGEGRQLSAVSALTKLLADPSADVREHALGALGEIREPTSAPAITPLLKDPKPSVRARAMNTLRDLHVAIAERTLLDALADESAEVRQQAAEAVSERPFAAAVPVLRGLIDDPNGDVRTQAVEALGNIGTAPAREALRAALSSKDPRVRRTAIEALGNKP
jgi:HEAT repeat protein/beta-lactamase regulating signal transducer with metallopeptidase domain